jgi:hypothetical protein
MPGGKKPPHKREQAIAALIACGSVEKAALQCGVSERTLRNWLAEPGFRTAYRQERRKLLDHAVLVLQTAAVQAVATLVKHMNGPKPESAVRAAQIILDQCFRGTEVLDLFEELEQLREEVRRVHADAQARNPEATGDAGPATADAAADPGADSTPPVPAHGSDPLPPRPVAEEPADDVLAGGVEPMFG